MVYWLYTEGLNLLGGVLTPLICLSTLMPVILALVLGRGIQRSDRAGQISAVGWRKLLVAVTYGMSTWRWRTFNWMSW